MRMRFLFVAAAICASGAFAVSASDEVALVKTPAAGAGAKHDLIWSGIVIATNTENPSEPPAELAEVVPRLKRVFGYDQFELFGGAANEIGNDTESWLVPSKSFWLGVRARRAPSKAARGGYLLNIQLFHNDRLLVTTEAKLAPDSPLFIRGPQYGKGQLIVVVKVQR